MTIRDSTYLRLIADTTKRTGQAWVTARAVTATAELDSMVPNPFANRSVVAWDLADMWRRGALDRMRLRGGDAWSYALPNPATEVNQ